MTMPAVEGTVDKRGAEDAGRYFHYMAEFIGFTAADAEAVARTRPVIEKHLADIVGRFYGHLLRYPPTRKHFLKADGAIDHEYVELRMRHLTNFWLRTAGGVYDDDYARYVDYVGRAHTSRGADPRIYIAERYVIGQVGFMQHAISEALLKELLPVDPDFAVRAEEAWDKLMMVILELLARAYGVERESEAFAALIPVDQAAVARLAQEAFAEEHGTAARPPLKDVLVAHAADIPDGERKLVAVDGLSIGVFHHRGNWYALNNSCLHRGGPVATGTLDGDVLTCPWHGFQYDVTNGKLLVDPSAELDMYPVAVRDGAVYVSVPGIGIALPPAAPAPAAALQSNAFCLADLPPGGVRQLPAAVDGQAAAVYNVGGTCHATQHECTHMGGPLSEGELDGAVITCPWHGSRFDVTTGAVERGPAADPLATYRVVVDGDIGRVEPG